MKSRGRGVEGTTSTSSSRSATPAPSIDRVLSPTSLDRGNGKAVQSNESGTRAGSAIFGTSDGGNAVVGIGIHPPETTLRSPRPGGKTELQEENLVLGLLGVNSELEGLRPGLE
jgi:hypothetical protein